MKSSAVQLLLGTLLATALVAAAPGAGGGPERDGRGPRRAPVAALRMTTTLHNPGRAKDSGYPDADRFDFPDSHPDDSRGAASDRRDDFARSRGGGALDPARSGALLPPWFTAPVMYGT